MSIRVMSEVWKHSRAAGVDLLVMLALADFSNDQGESFPSLRTLAEKSRLTPRGVCKILDRLQAAGEVRRDRSRGGKNRRTRYSIKPSNSEQHSVNSIQRTANTEWESNETVNSGSHALNRQGTTNKRGSTESDKPIPDSLSTKGNRKPTRPAPDPAQLEAFTRFYEAFPLHVGRAEAEKAWLTLNPDTALAVTIVAAARRYAEGVRDTEPKYIKHPGPWLNGRRWEDEPEVHASHNGNGHAEPEIKELDNGMVEVDGRQMDRKIFERRYGQAAI